MKFNRRLGSCTAEILEWLPSGQIRPAKGCKMALEDSETMINFFLLLKKYLCNVLRTTHLFSITYELYFFENIYANHKKFVPS